MKALLTISIFVLACLYAVYAQTPTYASLPDSSHVLVVYKVPADENDSLGNISKAVMEYYLTARGIPAVNVVRLNRLTNRDITIDGSTHHVKIAQEGDIIQDTVQNFYWSGEPTRHAWKYFLDNIAQPIKTHLTNNNLLSTIRYIVLCKGVPFKIQASGDWSGEDGIARGNLTVDGLLCMLNTDNYDAFILNTVYLNTVKPNGSFYIMTNPYFQVDPNLTMDFRFLPDRFSHSIYKLSYLVSHLDGLDYETVKGIIDRSKAADMTGTATWILDDDDTRSSAPFFLDTKNKLEALGFNVKYNNDGSWITRHVGPVMGYSSWGTHAENGNSAFTDSNWVRDSLKFFQFANGSVFNVLESYNGNSLGTQKWRWIPSIPPKYHHTQGLFTQFTKIGGTSGFGNAWEPYMDGVIQNNIFFPTYAIGYGLVDAAYMGMPVLAWQNVVVGDPLTRIYNQETEILTEDRTIADTEILNKKIIVPKGITLTIGGNVFIGRTAKIECAGVLILEQNAKLTAKSYSKIECSGVLRLEQSAKLTAKDYSKLKIKEIDASVDSHIELLDKASLNLEGELSGHNCKITASVNSQIIAGSLNLNANTDLTISGNASLIVLGDITINSGSNFEFKDNCTFKCKRLIANGATKFRLLNTAKFTAEELALSKGFELFLNSGTSFTITKEFTAIGSLANKILVSGGGNIMLNEVQNCQLNFVNFDGAGLSIIGTSSGSLPVFNISNSLFNNAGIGIFSLQNQSAFIKITDCTVQNFTSTAIDFEGNGSLELFNTKILGHGSSEPDADIIGVKLIGEGDYKITSSEIRYAFTGIKYGKKKKLMDQQPGLDGGSLLVDNVEIKYTQRGIDAVKINVNQVLTILNSSIISSNGISVTGISKVNILNNVLSSSFPSESDYGISLTSCGSATVKQNTITGFPVGLELNQVPSPYIIKNTIKNLPPGQVNNSSGSSSGIKSISSNGYYWENKIKWFDFGIELGSSSPKIGSNVITDNFKCGILVGSGSFVDMRKELSHLHGEPFDLFAISGYNLISKNGGVDEYKSAEIYFKEGEGILENGCNSITDDRFSSKNIHQYLIHGTYSGTIDATFNYWGDLSNYNNDPGNRIYSGDGIFVKYEGHLQEPCELTPSEKTMIIYSDINEPIDTVASVGRYTAQDSIVLMLALADNMFTSAKFTEAYISYKTICNLFPYDPKIFRAYKNLFTIAQKLSFSSAEYDDFINYNQQKITGSNNSFFRGMLNQIITLANAEKGNYSEALDRLDAIIQLNPNTDLEYYSTVDAYTIELKAMLNQSGFGKINSRYGIKDIDDYRLKLTELNKKKNSGKPTFSYTTPTDYSLYQNHPNPFNPTTRIQYDIPSDTKVELKIYDILGREVKTLVNEFQITGRYSVDFNSASLASGIYFYRIIAKGFVQSRKMLIIK